MLESYTDEEITEIRKSWLDRLEGIWKGEVVNGFNILTKEGYRLYLYHDGEVSVDATPGPGIPKAGDPIFKYKALYPELRICNPPRYFVKTDALKRHLIALIKDRDSKIAQDWTKLYA